jgi:hypothetical protein
MKGPVLGIAAVFILQLVVIGYGTASRFFDAPVEIGSVATSSQPLPHISDADFVEFELDVTVNAGVEESDDLRPVPAKASSSRTIAKGPGVRTFDIQFKPVTINVPKPSSYTFAAYEPSQPSTEFPRTQASDREPVTYEISAKTMAVRRKKSFFSKTFSVIKKPYDWMKVVGSKLK